MIVVTGATGFIGSCMVSKLNHENFKDIVVVDDFSRADKNLNLEVEEFKNLNPTAENISVVIYNKIKPKLKPDLELEVELYETPRNFVSYKGE